MDTDADTDRAHGRRGPAALMRLLAWSPCFFPIPAVASIRAPKYPLSRLGFGRRFGAHHAFDLGVSASERDHLHDRRAFVDDVHAIRSGGEKRKIDRRVIGV